MKYKIGALLCVVALLFALSACGKKTNTAGEGTTAQPQTSATEETSAAETGTTQSTQPETTVPTTGTEAPQQGGAEVNLGVTTRPPANNNQNGSGSDTQNSQPDKVPETTAPQSTEPTQEVPQETQEVPPGAQQHPGGVITGVTQRPPQSGQ